MNLRPRAQPSSSSASSFASPLVLALAALAGGAALSVSACDEDLVPPPAATGPDAGPVPTAPDAAVVSGQEVHVFQTSRAGDKLADKGMLPVYAGPVGAPATITVDPAGVRQTILGFGGALTESTASVLAKLSPEKRKQVIDAYYAPTGAHYTLARTHIASCDFSLASYQYSTTEDPTLADFSIDHDKAELLPLIKDAVAASGNTTKVMAAAWSAPAWMKLPKELYVKPSAANNFNGYDPILNPNYVDAYARYLVKYLKAYEAEGVRIWGLSPQNEVLGNGGNWETMRWSPASMTAFVRDKLGPMLEAEAPDTKIMVFDHNKGPLDKDAVTWAKTLLGDPGAAKYVWGTAIHWYASTVKTFDESLDAIHALDPSRAILATEATIDGLTDRAGMPPSPAFKDSWLKDEFYWTKVARDWGFFWAPNADKPLHPIYEPVYRYARDIIAGLNHWYVGWVDWNVALDTTGGPNHEGNLCAAPVLVNPADDSVYYTPLFYVMEHFSKFVLPDARVLSTQVALDASVPLEGYDKFKTTEGLMATASRNLDGSFAVVVFNQTAAPIVYDLAVGAFHARGTIDAQALQTLTWTGMR